MGLYDYEGGVEEMTAALNSGRRRAAALYRRGLCRMQLGALKAAEADFSAAIDARPTMDGARYNRGLCRMGLARKLAGAESAALYRRAAGDFAVSAQTETYVVDSLYNEALCRMQLGKYAQAAEILDGLLEDGIYGSAACLAAAICRMHTGDFAAAKAGFDLCVAAGYEVACAGRCALRDWAICGRPPPISTATSGRTCWLLPAITAGACSGFGRATRRAARPTCFRPSRPETARWRFRCSEGKSEERKRPRHGELPLFGVERGTRMAAHPPSGQPQRRGIFRRITRAQAPSESPERRTWRRRRR